MSAVALRQTLLCIRLLWRYRLSDSSSIRFTAGCTFCDFVRLSYVPRCSFTLWAISSAKDSRSCSDARDSLQHSAVQQQRGQCTVVASYSLSKGMHSNAAAGVRQHDQQRTVHSWCFKSAVLKSS
jgi:sirohydrochlorin ferrochelatase